jgi:cardiolipin synthase
LKTTKSSALVRALAVVGAGSIVVMGSRFLLNFFGPAVAYSMHKDMQAPLESDEFLRFISVVTNGTVRKTRLKRLKNGCEYYPAELKAIREAKKTISMEFYEFVEGQVGDEMIVALAERAAAGVVVQIIVDAMGSFYTHTSYFDPIRAAGGKMFFYHPISWNTWQYANNRTHRKLIVVDGSIGFLGGSGVADHWIKPTHLGPTWRDTMFEVRGEAVAGLTSTFAGNWLAVSGEILSGPGHFDSTPEDGPPSFILASTPHGGSTQARVLLQALINCARHSICITTPYFLPDRSVRQALIDAQKRGVRVRILTAGPKIDHPAVRSLGHHSSRRMVESGAEIYEYQPSMIHAKLMTVDGQWSTLGSANFDHRSFALNDEVIMAIRDPETAATIDADFEEDLTHSRRLTMEMLKTLTVMGGALEAVSPFVMRES